MVYKKILKIFFKKIESELSGKGLDKYYVVKKSYKFLQSNLKSDYVEIDGNKMFLDKFDSLRLSINGIYEEYETKMIKNIIKKGDIVLDIGSHLGTFTHFALKKGAQQVVAFEPEPTNISCFKRTFAGELRNGKVALVEAAAWHSSDTLRFQRNELSYNGHVKDQGWSNATAIKVDDFLVQAVTIDDQVEKLGLNKVDLIKMDIEGAERHALAGAKETLKNFAPKLVLCTYHRADDPMVIPEIVLGVRSTYQMLKSREQVYFYEPN